MKRLLPMLTTAVLATALLAPTSRAAEPDPLQYVALGDSYAAGSGVFPLARGTAPQCLQSTRNFSHDIAAATGAQLTDVTCGGAQTSHFFSSQYQGVAPQLDAVTADTDLVTMTIGGNDSNLFIGAVLKCGAAAIGSFGRGHPCQDRYGSTFEDTIDSTTYPSLVRALAAVRAKAPDARVAILGYPWLVPATGSCLLKMPVASGDVPYLRHIEGALNDAIERAAAATGASFVDLSVASDGHDACKRVGVRWVEPFLGGNNVVHPNAFGEAQMARQAMLQLGLQ
ncbi:SGNH/GDSL hydrolase family protein [Nocardioides sp. MH1]|uniref:SGNH/GDSL hydrolase family protein n=1 Tax=Nocardioides sp. MH1 TaxID=3242490 RepID=UPI0035229BD0